MHGAESHNSGDKVCLFEEAGARVGCNVPEKRGILDRDVLHTTLIFSLLTTPAHQV